MFVVAIDTGCTKIASAVVDEAGKIHRQDRYTRDVFDKDSTMRVYADIVEGYRQSYPVSAIGLGTGGRIDVKTGKYNFGTTAISGWEDTNIIAELQSLCHLPVAVENDCKAAMIGEGWKGAVKGYDTVLGVLIGTGLGGGYLYHGEMVYGNRYGACEMGHSILYPNGKKCLCGQYGCGEMYCSGTAIWQAYNDRNPATPIGSGYEFFDLYRSGDSVAAYCLDRFCLDLAVLLVSFANLFDPQVILIGGGIADAGEYWWSDMMKYYNLQGATFVQEIPVVASVLGNTAPLMGAAKIAIDLLT